MNENENLNNQVGSTPVTPVPPVAPAAPEAPVPPVEPGPSAPVPPTPGIPVPPAGPGPVAPVPPTPGAPVPPVGPGPVPPAGPNINPATGLPQAPLQQPQPPKKSNTGFYVIAAILVVAIIALVVVLVVVLGKKGDNGGSSTTTTVPLNSTSSTTAVSTTGIPETTIVITTQPNTTTVARTTVSPDSPPPTPVGANNQQVTINGVSVKLPDSYEVYDENGLKSIASKTKHVEMTFEYYGGFTLQDVVAEKDTIMANVQGQGFTVTKAGTNTYGGRQYVIFELSGPNSNIKFVYGFTSLGGGVVEFMCAYSSTSTVDVAMGEVNTIFSTATVASSFSSDDNKKISVKNVDYLDTRIIE